MKTLSSLSVKLLLLTISTFIIISCKKEIVEVEVEKIVVQEFSWKKHTSFTFANTEISSSAIYGDSLYLLGPRTLGCITSTNTTLYFNYMQSAKRPIGRYFTPVLFNESYILFGDKMVRDFSGPITNADPDSTIKEANLKNEFAYWEYSCAINNKNQLLTPVRIKSSLSTNNFLLQDFSVEDIQFGLHVELTSSKLVTLEDPIYSAGISGLCAISDNFFLSLGKSAYKIRPDGSFKLILSEGISQFIQHNNQILAISRYEIFSSEDEGESWKSLVKTSTIPFQFYSVNNRLIGSNEDKIAELFITDTSVSSKEIINDGLTGNTITTINSFNGDIYIGTLSGVYYKKEDDFWTYIEE
jgi:hypothetical protein